MLDVKMKRLPVGQAGHPAHPRGFGQYLVSVGDFGPLNIFGRRRADRAHILVFHEVLNHNGYPRIYGSKGAVCNIDNLFPWISAPIYT